MLPFSQGHHLRPGRRAVTSSAGGPRPAMPGWTTTVPMPHTGTPAGPP
jgi:hypothetical protein